MSVLSIMNKERAIGAKAVVEPLAKSLTKALDDMEQWAGDIEEDHPDGTMLVQDVQKRVKYLVELMQAHVREAEGKLNLSS